MPYIFGYSQRRLSEISTGEAPNAKLALKAVKELQFSDETIRYIKDPWGRDIGVEELEVLAAQEGEPPINLP